MDAPSNRRSGGLKFAEQQMQRHGWTEGKGLGKREDGISEAIKVKVKCGTAGVGHNSAEQFTFHWWDHVFNKTASSISVEPDQDGVQVKKRSGDDTTVSNKKPRKAMLTGNLLYGRFIKSSTLTSGGEKPVVVESSSSSSSSSSSDSSEDEDSKLDLSSATKLSDEDLLKICGGRTAHKGARHGLTMSAKLLRIEEQERAFMEKYGKKETKLQPSKSTSEVPGGEVLNEEETKKEKKRRERNGEEQDNPCDSKVLKKKKKKKLDCEELVEDAPNGHDQEHVPPMEKKKKKKRRRRKGLDKVETVEETEVPTHHKNSHSVEEETTGPAKKRKGKTYSDESVMEGDPGHQEDKDHGDTDEKAGKSKKMKKKRTEDHEEVKDEEPSKKPKNKWKVEEDDRSAEESRSQRKEEDTTAKKKKKKSKHKDRKD